MYTISHKFGNSNDIYGYGYFAYIEDGQLVIGENWPREGGITYRGTYRDATERLQKLKTEDELLWQNIELYYSIHKEGVVEPFPENVISAEDARKISELNMKKDAWSVIFKLIKKQCELGSCVLTFDEEEEDVYFKEHRKVVKSRLEELGYKVIYCRVRNNGRYFTSMYHNRYVIAW